MKKIIAFTLCSATSCFGLNMPSTLKPNPLSQSWNNLSFTSQAMIIVASVVSLVGILYTAWPVSEQSARKEAEQELNYRKNMLSHQHQMYDKDISELNNYFESNAAFYFGPFWNRNKFLVAIDLLPCTDEQTRQPKTELVIDLIKKKPGNLCEKRYIYNVEKKQWHESLFNFAMQ